MTPSGDIRDNSSGNEIVQIEGAQNVVIRAGSFELVTLSGHLADVSVKIDGREARNIERLEVIADARSGRIDIWLKIFPEMSMFE